MRFTDPCPKSLRMMITYYQRQLMSEQDIAKREVYIQLLRSLDQQLADKEKTENQFLAKELIAYSS